MSTLKRSASPGVLVGKPSPFHTSVTLFTSDAVSASNHGDTTSIGVLTTRRSKRIKLEQVENPIPEQRDEKPELPDSEEPLPRKRKTRAASKNAVASSSNVKLEEVEVKTVVTPQKSKKQASPKKPKPIQQSLDVPHPAPPQWKETYDTIKEMRAKIVAPVDTMGCDQAQFKEQDPRSRRFSTLVSLMLSSQTKDEVTDAAVSKLRDALGGSLTVEAMLQADDATIAEAIAKVGFWRRKTEYLKRAAQKLKDDFDSDVPKTVDELCSLPGVGPKMAFLALQVAWNINVGIGVDVHVHRITNRLGWHKPPTKNPEETRLNLQSWLPTELHPEINHMLVGFGQMVCLPVGPKCGECELSSGLCPSAKKVVKTSKTRKVTKTSQSNGGPKIEVKLEEEIQETKTILEPPTDASSPLTDID